MALKKLLLSLALLALAGCGTTQEITPRERNPEGFAAWSSAPQSYRLGAGDKLKFDFPLTPENNEEAVVGPDGYVGLRIAGRVHVSGLSVDEAQAAVSLAAGRQLRNPMLVASIVDARAARIIVGGAVARPGVFPMAARTTVFEAVALAGGLQPEARMTSIVVVRLREDGAPMLRTVDLRRFASRGSLEENIALASEDMVFVPRSRVAEVNLWIEQYINRNLPFGRSVNYTHTNTAPVVP